MLDYLWAILIIIGIVYGAFTGHFKELTEGSIQSAGEAVSLCISMLGVMAFWCGLMEIAKESGLIKKLTSGIQPVVSFLFPNVPKDHEAREHISMNIIANLLGLGWAATPSGLKAMEALADERLTNGRKNTATDAMCTFLILNISSLQLIPVNMIAYRSQYGSVQPAAVIGPGLIATTISTVVGILFCKLSQKN